MGSKSCHLSKNSQSKQTGLQNHKALIINYNGASVLGFDILLHIKLFILLLSDVLF